MKIHSLSHEFESQSRLSNYLGIVSSDYLGLVLLEKDLKKI